MTFNTVSPQLVNTNVIMACDEYYIRYDTNFNHDSDVTVCSSSVVVPSNLVGTQHYLGIISSVAVSNHDTLIGLINDCDSVNGLGTQAAYQCLINTGQTFEQFDFSFIDTSPKIIISSFLGDVRSNIFDSVIPVFVSISGILGFILIISIFIKLFSRTKRG